MTSPKKIAILGAGPVGLEAALLAASKGHDVHVFERGRVGEHVRNWSHVTFFSPWELNRSPWGVAALTESGADLAADDVFPTGAEYLSGYLEPLAALPKLEGRIHEGCEVVAIARDGALKGAHVGGRDDALGPFNLLVRQGDDERYEHADLVIDTTGAYRAHNALGPGGLPALGETRADTLIERYVPDVLGADRDLYAGKRVLVVGAGYSAVTSLKLLHALKADEPSTHVSWLVLGEDEPYEVLPDDPLPQRSALATFGNAAASGGVDGITTLRSSRVEALRTLDDGALEVTISRGGSPQRFVVDRVVSNVGYRPDLELARELQVHLCYASEGPMKLAASLLAVGGGGGDCLAQTSAGVETLMNPERDFFVLGAKSYGRNSAFLLKLGFEQVASVLGLLDAP